MVVHSFEDWKGIQPLPDHHREIQRQESNQDVPREILASNSSSTIGPLIGG